MKNKRRFYIDFIQSWHEKEKGEHCVWNYTGLASGPVYSSKLPENTVQPYIMHCCARNRLHCSKLYLYCCWTVQNNSWTVTLFKTFEAQQGSNLLRASHSHEMPLLHNQRHKLPNFQQISFHAFTNNKCWKNGFTIYHTCFHFVLLIQSQYFIKRNFCKHFIKVKSTISGADTEMEIIFWNFVWPSPNC